MWIILELKTKKKDQQTLVSSEVDSDSVENPAKKMNLAYESIPITSLDWKQIALEFGCKPFYIRVQNINSGKLWLNFPTLNLTIHLIAHFNLGSSSVKSCKVHYC